MWYEVQRGDNIPTGRRRRMGLNGGIPTGTVQELSLRTFFICFGARRGEDA
jgi:hypothetical protein